MIRLELLKLRRSRRPLLALLSIGVFLTLMLVGFWTYAENLTGGQVEFRYTFENRSWFNGLTFTLYAFYFGFLLILPIFVATEGGTQIAGETASGSLRMLLTRPISKSRLFFTKFGIVGLYAAGLVAGLLGISLGVGLLAVGWGELSLYPGVLQMTERPQHLGQNGALLRFALVWPLATLALLTPAAFAFLLSTWMRSAVNAAGTAVSLYLVLYVVSGVHFFADLRPYLFTSYLAYWRGLFQEEIPWGDLGRDAAKLCAWTFLFLALAHHRFRKRQEA